MKRWTCSYKREGVLYGTTVEAETLEDAIIIAAYFGGWVEGEQVLEVPVEDPDG